MFAFSQDGRILTELDVKSFQMLFQCRHTIIMLKIRLAVSGLFPSLNEIAAPSSKRCVSFVDNNGM